MKEDPDIHVNQKEYNEYMPMALLEHKIGALNRMYRRLDRHLSAFKRRSGLACVYGCGLCCRTGELNATVIEFLPSAYDLYQKGESNRILGQIADKKDTICVFYNPFKNGMNCTQYQHRALVCRLFGFSVRNDKLGVPNLVTCVPIKRSMEARQTIQLLEKAPNLSSYYMRLYGIDPALSNKDLPVNQAIKGAIEQVSLYFNFRRKPA